MKEISFELIPVAPYSFDLQWKFYSSDKPQPETYKNGVWRRAFIIENKLVPVDVTSIGTLEKPRLKISTFFEINAEEKNYISKKITEIFGLEEDISGLYDFMSKDRILNGIKGELYGLRPPARIGASIFEGVVRVIIQQQISLRVAYIMTGALVKRFGGFVEISNERYYGFPSPETLAKASDDELRECKLSSQKARYIREFSSEVVNGYDLEELKEMEDEDVIERLMGFNGIGRWSAELISITALGRMNLCVPDDLGTRKSVSYFYFDGKLQSGDIVRKFVDRWGRFRGWITYYLMCAYNLKMAARNRGR